VKFTDRQIEAQEIMAGDATHILAVGGSRSGKTFLFLRNIVMRALKAPGSRHGIFRFRLSHLIATVYHDTFPKMMNLCFPDVSWTPHNQEKYLTIGDGSEIWFAGLDDKERTEKVLGFEFVTLFLNETSQIPYDSVVLARTRLSQQVEQKIQGRQPIPMKLRAYYDENPPRKNHWTYREFIEKISPDTRQPLFNAADYAYFYMNPADNKENLAENYLQQLDAMPARMRIRFRDGRFSDATPNALFSEEDVDKWRVEDGAIPDLVRVIVAVDPSGSGDIDNATNDEIGIVVVGLGTDGNAYVLEDVTVKAGPSTWGKTAISAYDRHGADCIIAEINFGGAMVNQTIQVARPRTPFKAVRASRGKVARAEPFSALYEQGKIRHVGRFVEMEDELSGFSTNGYTGSKSPNRADALIWGLAELFPIMMQATKKKIEAHPLPIFNRWR